MTPSGKKFDSCAAERRDRLGQTHRHNGALQNQQNLLHFGLSDNLVAPITQVRLAFSEGKILTIIRSIKHSQMIYCEGTY